LGVAFDKIDVTASSLNKSNILETFCRPLHLDYIPSPLFRNCRSKAESKGPITAVADLKYCRATLDMRDPPKSETEFCAENLHDIFNWCACEFKSMILDSFLNNPQAVLLVSSLFWKPVLRNETLPDRRLALDMQRMWPAEIGQLFRVFGLLWECEEAREFAVFPLGILRLPPLDKQVHVSGALRAAMRGATGGWKFHVLDGYTEDATELCGLPVVAYERLDESWIFGMPEDVGLLEMWIEAIKRSMDAFLAAGVVHLDLRPQNTAFRVDSQGLKVRVVDWDFSGVLGEVLSDDVTAFLSEDKRFPNITRASKDAHLWFWGWMKRCVDVKRRGVWGGTEFNQWVIDEVDEGRGNLQDILKESEMPRDPAS
jgi:hypothetical protein